MHRTLYGRDRLVRARTPPSRLASAGARGNPARPGRPVPAKHDSDAARAGRISDGRAPNPRPPAERLRSPGVFGIGAAAVDRPQRTAHRRAHPGEHPWRPSIMVRHAPDRSLSEEPGLQPSEGLRSRIVSLHEPGSSSARSDGTARALRRFGPAFAGARVLDQSEPRAHAGCRWFVRTACLPGRDGAAAGADNVLLLSRGALAGNHLVARPRGRRSCALCVSRQHGSSRRSRSFRRSAGRIRPRETAASRRVGRVDAGV